MNPLQSSKTKDDRDEIQTQLTLLTDRCAQLDEINHAWQQFHQHQLELFRQALKDSLPLEENSTLEEMAQQIVDHLAERTPPRETLSSTDHPSADFNGYQSSSHRSEEHRQEQADDAESARTNYAEEELQQLRSELVRVSADCSQLNEVNQAWQQFQHTQLDNLRKQFHAHLSIPPESSFDETLQLILDHLESTMKAIDNANQQLFARGSTDDRQTQTESLYQLWSTVRQHCFLFLLPTIFLGL